MSLTDEKVKELEHRANAIRQGIIHLLVDGAGSGHSGGPLGMADIFTVLYFHTLNHDPKNPTWPDRDRLILSNGHIAPVRYVAMHQAGYDITDDEMKTLRKIGSRLEGHPSHKRLPAMETSSGPLGEGLSLSSGIALGLRMDKKKGPHVWCLTSDGEHQEGMTWEAVMFAGKYMLNNLTVIVDRNNIQIDGNTEDIMPLEPLADKYRAFNWHVMEMNGHDMREIASTLDEAKSIQEKPVCIIANTIPGKGVSFMENDYRWHGIPPGQGPEDIIKKEDQIKEALRELQEIEN